MLNVYLKPARTRHNVKKSSIVASLLGHALVAGTVIGLSARAVALPPEDPPNITFVRPAAVADMRKALAPAPSTVRPAPTERTHAPRKRDAVPPVAPATAPAQTDAPASEQDSPRGDATASQGASTIGASVASRPVSTYSQLPFGPGMTLPQVLSRPALMYTSAARAARVSGLAVVRCVITKQGRAINCHAIQGLPHGMTEQVIAMLQGSRYTPVSYQGQLQEVRYTFPIRIHGS